MNEFLKLIAFLIFIGIMVTIWSYRKLMARLLVLLIPLVRFLFALVIGISGIIFACACVIYIPKHQDNSLIWYALVCLTVGGLMLSTVPKAYILLKAEIIELLIEIRERGIKNIST